MKRIWMTAAAGLAVAAVSPLTASAAVHPRIVSLDASPQLLSKDGGRVVVTARVSSARTCAFAGQAAAGGSFVTHAAMPCRKGSVRALLVVSANPNTTASTIRFRVTVHGAAGPAVVRTIAVIQAPGDPPPPPVPALTVSSTSLPGGAVGAPYAATLAATGGSPPYVWSVASGSLPPGLTLSSPGALTGTPTLAGQWSVGLRIQDAAGRTAAATFAIAISAPAPSPPPTTPTYTSGNWSGYMALGGPYTGVTGTFNVPQLYAGTLVSATAEWMIQAGVDESYSPSTNTYSVFAWFELYPAPTVAVPLPVSPGNEIAVTIQQISLGLWNIAITNLSTGQSYSSNQAWTGPATSAEWILEAPYSTSLGQLPVAGYTPVTFTRLGVSPVVGSLARLVMVQNGVTVSVPSSLTTNGFTVAYGSVTPAAP